MLRVDCTVCWYSDLNTQAKRPVNANIHLQAAFIMLQALPIHAV